MEKRKCFSSTVGLGVKNTSTEHAKKKFFAMKYVSHKQSDIELTMILRVR